MKSEHQKRGFSLIRGAVDQLRSLITDALLDKGINVFPVQTSMFAINSKGKIFTSYYEPIIIALRSGFVPVLHGDIVFDHKLGATILSGDQIIKYLSLLLPPTKIYFVTDVDGIYTSDPKTDPKAKLIPEITRRDLLSGKVQVSIEGSAYTDVTGGMKGKFAEIRDMIDEGHEIYVLNGRKEGALYDAVKGNTEGLTYIHP